LKNSNTIQMLENHSNIRNSFNNQKSLKYSKIIEIHEKSANNRKSSKNVEIL